MVGRILVEVFRAAVNNKMTLVIEEVIQNVRYVVYDLGKLLAIVLIKCMLLIIFPHCPLKLLQFRTFEMYSLHDFEKGTLVARKCGLISGSSTLPSMFIIR